MSQDRVALIQTSTTLTGIDFVQIAPAQTEILIILHHNNLPPAVATALAALPATAFSITGEGQVSPSHVRVTEHVVPLPAKLDGRAVLKIRTAAPGGFGFYRLHIASNAIDPYFNNIRFSFKAACDTALDCQLEALDCPTEEPIDFPVDYRARDFWSYRQALIDFAAQRYPHWQDRLEADIGMMALELIAAMGDEFAYANDRIAREAALDTALQRRSLRHLSRLVDYQIDEGSGAFVWVDAEASAAANIPAGTAITDTSERLVFEIGHGLSDHKLGVPPAAPPACVQYAVDPLRNTLLPYIWDENDTCLMAGNTELTLAGAHAVRLQPDLAIDPSGRWIALITSPVAPNQPERRMVVKVTLAVDDIDPLLPAKPPITRIKFTPPLAFDFDLETLVVRGNLVPATAGETHTARFRVGPSVSPTDPDADLPRAIERVGPGSALCYPEPSATADEEARVKMLFSLEGSDAVPLVWLQRNSGASSPELEVVREKDCLWPWRPSLVGETTAEPGDKLITLEDGIFRRLVSFERFGQVTELIDYASSDGSTIRFGDGQFGMMPPEGSIYSVRYRLGNGSRMNVAADTLTRLRSAVPGISAINNPLAASGGRDPEVLDAVRTNAPQAFRAITYRAVQTSDYADFAKDVNGVQKAGAVSRWTGSWPTIFVTPDPADTNRLLPRLRRTIDLALDTVRQAGREVKIADPRYADIDLEIEICVAPNAYRGEVKRAALDALFGRRGDSGFFDPDNFTFGVPLSRSKLIAALQTVPGVRAVEAMRVRRRGYFDWRPFRELELLVGVNELVRVANQRELAEHGAVRLMMEGGA
jgi:Baseplate J-like protein